MAALNLDEPDRVPVDLMGHACMLTDETYFRFRDYLGLDPIPPIREGTSANYYDERILEYLNVDYRRVFLKTRPKYRVVVHEDGTWTDFWGIRSEKVGPFVNIAEYPLSGAQTVEEVEAYNWPVPEEVFSIEGVAEEAKRLYEESDCAIVARNPLSYGFRERACMLMEMDIFMMNIVLYPDMVRCLISNLLEFYKTVFGMFLDAVGPYVHCVEVGDDLAGNENLLISARMYREFFKPVEKEFFDFIHQKAPDAKLVRHTDGAVFPLIPDQIEIGVDVLNPIQTQARGMDPFKLKETFGDKLAFHGGIQNVENEVSVDDVVAEVKWHIDALAPGGGYVVSSCNHMLNVRPEVLIAMFETACEYGRYK
jgi:uroporphyrinogen decarboxylase